MNYEKPVAGNTKTRNLFIVEMRYVASLLLLLLLLPAAPGLRAQGNTGKTVCAGMSYTIPSALPASAGSTYYWTENGVEIPGADGPRYACVEGKATQGTYVYVRHALTTACPEVEASLPTNAYIVHVLPLHFASPATYGFGSYVWSESVRMPDCKDAVFEFSDTEPHCRSYTSGANTYYYYNYAYVVQHGAAMCPAPCWSVPGYAEIYNLYKSASYGDGYWGRGGIITTGQGTDPLHPTAAFGLRSSGTEVFIDNLGQFFINTLSESDGAMLRCVRNL
ncbi:MAG: hypothetical protein LBT49_00125 [Prevotellaceae bacterium]|jgi:hypothetical protein|nr:hypothetical protein [Prevotellaceae bacterium]